MHGLPGFASIIGQAPHGPLWWQMAIRAILIFLYGVLLIRLIGWRVFGKQTPVEIVVAIIVGSSLSRALTGNAAFLPTLVATTVMVLIFWVFEHIAARSRLFSWLVKGAPVPLAHDGGLDQKAMRFEAVSRGDLEEAARSSGIPSLDKLQSGLPTMRATTGHPGA